MILYECGTASLSLKTMDSFVVLIAFQTLNRWHFYWTHCFDVFKVYEERKNIYDVL